LETLASFKGMTNMAKKVIQQENAPAAQQGVMIDIMI